MYRFVFSFTEYEQSEIKYRVFCLWKCIRMKNSPQVIFAYEDLRISTDFIAQVAEENIPAAIYFLLHK